MKIELTTESPLSSYGIPIARIDGKDYGPADLVDKERTAAALVLEWVKNNPTEEETARRFLSQRSDGPQLLQARKQT